MHSTVVDTERFTILQYSDYYRMVKKCSVTNELFSVKLSQEDFLKYYTNKGKDMKHLDFLSKDEKDFLESTLTPKEILALNSEDRKLPKKHWKKAYGSNNMDAKTTRRNKKVEEEL